MADEIYLATGNLHKLREVRQILGSRVIGYTLPVNENGKTFEANAIKKAKAVMRETGQLAIADDSGLMVDCLGGSPGVRSARFASPPTPQNLCGKLLKLMKGCRNRNARFVCAIAIAYPSGATRVVTGTVNGKIADRMLGRHGFGYDPVFIPAGYRETFAEMKPAMKNRLSHRGRALRKLREVIP
jgi:XTP/dITP diphosphohydrolase